MATKHWAILVVILATLLTSSGQLLYKIGSRNLDLATIYMNYYIIIGLFVYLAAGIMVLFALKGGELSVIYPFIALSFVWVSISSTIFINESMNALKWLGVFTIIAGISFIGIGSSKVADGN
ncbi:hypothetical protein HY638_00805 [Candidatus Woesearchaeota archaeon]|nr:hypothetical protein [Candidatus Woesearchaeota archaeon]